MCGRYYIDDDTAAEIEKIVNNIDAKFKTGEIFPTNQVPILTSATTTISTWGFPNFKNKGVIINARSETAFEKSMFRNSLLGKRCLIPATGFYEWNKQKEKFYFTSIEHTLYFCGLYNTYESENRFVILTTSANNSMSAIHDRMPLILSEQQHDEWLHNDAATQLLLKETPVLLNSSTKYEQQTLTFE